MRVAAPVVRVLLIVAGAVVCLALSACAHKDLTAPCTASSTWGSAFAADEAGCGPMRPIN
jgi:hypothetical protein